MQLLAIRAAGFTATVDACARDDGQIWFLSLLGDQQSVRALWAPLVKGEFLRSLATPGISEKGDYEVHTFWNWVRATSVPFSVTIS